MPNMSNEKIIATPDAARKYDFSQCDFSEAKDLSNNCSAEVLPGGKYNAQFTTYLDIIADYANGLGDIPVLFRPFHENTGGWFWWGAATTDKETYRALFQYTQDYLASKGVHNFIYVYSPNGPLTSEEEVYGPAIRAMTVWISLHLITMMITILIRQNIPASLWTI